MVVQIGNYHLGRAETAKQPKMDAGEIFLLWDMLVSRYDIIAKTQIHQNFAHDYDLKTLLSVGLSGTLEKQATLLENEMNTHRIPLPVRNPKSVNLPSHSEVLDDEFIYRDVFFGIQGFLDYHARVIRSITTNDKFRKQLIDMAIEELYLFDRLVKFGKLKGWLKVPPIYQSS
ncbi:MAG: DUF3231 family protein [Firmicutes bacterium]|nr:DUF3231 family protein [Bacillota bacterium]MTI85918.1 DUF3231 family protein [Bacillota bacterium]